MDTRRLMLFGIDTNLPPEETCYDYILGPMTGTWLKGHMNYNGSDYSTYKVTRRSYSLSDRDDTSSSTFHVMLVVGPTKANFFYYSGQTFLWWHLSDNATKPGYNGGSGVGVALLYCSNLIYYPTYMSESYFHGELNNSYTQSPLSDTTMAIYIWKIPMSDISDIVQWATPLS